MGPSCLPLHVGGLLFRLTLATSLAVLSCATSSQPPPETTVTVTADVPLLTPMAETKQSQEKGGVEVSVAPVTFQATPDTVVTTHRAEPKFEEALTRPSKNSVLVEKRSRPILKVTPERLRFTVKINNKLPRVFRAGGTVVQFNVAGKLAAVDQAGYAELANAIIPPRGEQQVEVYGPPIKTIPGDCTVGLFFYDVPTKTDAAGNITEKQNFEWYFKYATQRKEETGNVTVERVWQ
jgi:hypothetical protein